VGASIASAHCLSIEAASPGLDETDVRVALFERLYGGDCDDGTRARIVERLRCQADA